MTDNSEIILHFLRRIDARLDLLERSAVEVEVAMTNLEAALGHLALLRADYQAAIAEKRAVKRDRAPDDDLDALLASLRDTSDQRKQDEADAEADLDALLASLGTSPAAEDVSEVDLDALLASLGGPSAESVARAELDALMASLDATCEEKAALAELDALMEELQQAEKMAKPIDGQE